jgi:hypothetical protein
MTPTQIMEAEHRLIETVVQDLYQNHIWKEDAMVFPMADKVLTAADPTELCAKFAEADRAIGSETMARLERFARSLATGAVPAFQAGGPPTGGSGCRCGHPNEFKR